MVDQERMDLWDLWKGASSPVASSLSPRAWFTHSFNTKTVQQFKYTLSIIESYCELNIPTEKVCQTLSNKITGQVSISESFLKILDNNPNRKVKTVVLYWTLFRKINKYKKGLFNHAIHDWQNKFRHSIGAAWSWSTNKRFYRQLQS